MKTTISIYVNIKNKQFLHKNFKFYIFFQVKLEKFFKQNIILIIIVFIVFTCKQNTMLVPIKKNEIKYKAKYF